MSRKPHKYWLTRHFLVQQLSKMGLYIFWAKYAWEIIHIYTGKTMNYPKKNVDKVDMKE